MSTLNRNGLENSFSQKIPTNSNEEVSAEDVRDSLRDFKDSKFNLLEDDIRDLRDVTPIIGKEFPSIYDKLLFLIGNTGERKLFYVDSSRVDSGQLVQTHDPSATVTSNNGSPTITNSAPFSSSNRITITMPSTFGFDITRVTATSLTTPVFFIYDVQQLNVTPTSVSFVLTRNNPSNSVGAVRFDFYGEQTFFDPEYIADL